MLMVIGSLPMVDRMSPILEEEPENEIKKEKLAQVKGDIELRAVNFHYHANTPVLKNINLSIKQGEYIGIVGRSGSGKSTLLNLLLGFEQATQGGIIIDGNNIKDIDISYFRQQIGTVLQQGSVLPGSIYENITCGDHHLTMDDAWNAAEKAGLKEDIEDLPMGLHTLLSEMGGGLSGGQLQRLMIARSLARNPSILLFDEATSALDNRTQKVVQETLERMKITRIVIAHRLSTIRNVDRIYVIDKHVIAESGSYDSLMEQQGLFYELTKLQMEG